MFIKPSLQALRAETMVDGLPHAYRQIWNWRILLEQTRSVVPYHRKKKKTRDTVCCQIVRGNYTKQPCTTLHASPVLIKISAPPKLCGLSSHSATLHKSHDLNVTLGGALRRVFVQPSRYILRMYLCLILYLVFCSREFAIILFPIVNRYILLGCCRSCYAFHGHR